MGRNNYFQFKQFRVVQQHSAMKVGVDGVLIGSWADVSGAHRILDIGAGTGLIALMMAQRCPQAMIDAIDIDPEACMESQFNAEQSPWAERINVKCSSLEDYVKTCDQKYDLIVSNPPYFSNGIKAPHLSRSAARHADSLPLDELMAALAILLVKGAKSALILPSESLSEVKHLTDKNKLFLSRLCLVKPNPSKPAFRIMVELTNEPSTLKEEELMIEYDQHFDYTPEYRKLTRDFYLKFD
ncbi:MAG TPA: methyltransferase [Prolixibacteraceae bacterium]|nr:methyltransferase [Prolixibacteraceae bacterium]